MAPARAGVDAHPSVGLRTVPGARRGPVVLAAACALATVAVGCGGGGASSSPEAAVSASVDATRALNSFHFAFDSKGIPPSTSGLQLLGAEGDALVPDRVRADVSGTFAGLALSTALVAIGRDVWIKDPLAGSWRSADVGTTPAFLLDPATGVLGVMRRVGELHDDGSEDVGGVETRKLTGTAAVADVAPLFAVTPGEGRVDVTLWIGKDDEILRRVEVRGPVGAGEPADATRVVEISRLNEPVTIEPPGAGA
jgi:lipoprotein LprG